MMEVRITHYQFAYGKRPRGFGIWAFRIKGRIIYSTPMKYGDAVKVMRKHAASEGARIIEVLP